MSEIRINLNSEFTVLINKAGREYLKGWLDAEKLNFPINLQQPFEKNYEIALKTGIFKEQGWKIFQIFGHDLPKYFQDFNIKIN